jgi:hypothetical protein
MIKQIHAPVLTVNYVVQDGKSHWFKGMILVGESRLHFGFRSCSALCRFVRDLGCHVLVLPWYIAI